MDTEIYITRTKRNCNRNRKYIEEEKGEKKLT